MPYQGAEGAITGEIAELAGDGREREHGGFR